MGHCPTERLEGGILISDNRRHHVQRLVFYPAQISDHDQIGSWDREMAREMAEEDPERCISCSKPLSKEALQLEFQNRLKKRIDRNSDTHNDSELRLIRYLGAHAHVMEAQKLLFKNDTVVNFLVRIFRRLPNMHDVDIFTGRSYVGGAKLTRSFEGFSVMELDYSGRNTLQSFCKALDGALVKVHRLAFITDTMLCPNNYEEEECDLYYRSSAGLHRKRCDFGMSESEFWEAHSVVHHLPSTLRCWLSNSLLSNLREFRLYLELKYRHLTGAGDECGPGLAGDLYPGLSNVFAHARSLERLELGLNWNSYRHGVDSELEAGLDVGAAFTFNYAYPTRLKHIELRQCEPKKLDNVLKLFQMCADVLEVVYVEDVLDKYHSWREILQRLKEHQFPSLKRFDVYDPGQDDRYDAVPYLQGLEAHNPIPEQVKYSSW